MGSLIFMKCRQSLSCVNNLITSFILDELSLNHYLRGYLYPYKSNTCNQRTWNNININNKTLYTHLYLGIYKSNVYTNAFRHFSSGIVQRKFVCSNCKKDLDSSVFCNHCNSIQQVDGEADCFQIVGITRSYQIDNSNLKSKYHKLQSLLHPDKFSSKSKREQELSEECSSVVNKAYSTLSHPLERGLYLLSLYNITIEEGTTEVDNMFLMEIMERNEEIENVSDPQKLKEFQMNNKMELDKLTSDVTKAFNSNDLSLAKKLLTKMKYYNTIDGKIKEIKQKLNIPD